MKNQWKRSIIWGVGIGLVCWMQINSARADLSISSPILQSGTVTATGSGLTSTTSSSGVGTITTGSNITGATGLTGTNISPISVTPAPSSTPRLYFCTQADFDGSGIAEFVNSAYCSTSNPQSPTPWDNTSSIWGNALDGSNATGDGTAGCLHDFAAAWAQVSSYQTGAAAAQSAATSFQGASETITPLSADDRKNAKYVPSQCYKTQNIQEGGTSRSITSPNDYRMVHFSGNATSQYNYVALKTQTASTSTSTSSSSGTGITVSGALSGVQTTTSQLTSGALQSFQSTPAQIIMPCYIDLTNYSSVSQYVHVEGRYAISERFVPVQSDNTINTALNEGASCACKIGSFVSNTYNSTNTTYINSVYNNPPLALSTVFTNASFSAMLTRFKTQLTTAGNSASQALQATAISNLASNSSWSGPNFGIPDICNNTAASSYWTSTAINNLSQTAATAISSYNTAMIANINQTRVAVKPYDKKIISLFVPNSSQASGASAPFYTQDVQNTAPNSVSDTASIGARDWYLVQPYQTLHLEYDNDLLYYQFGTGGSGVTGTQVCSGVVEVCDDSSAKDTGFIIGSGDIQYLGGSPVNYDPNVNPTQNYLSAPVSINGGKAF